MYPLSARTAIVRAQRCVDATFVEHGLDAERRYLTEDRADVLVMGDDREGRSDHLADVCRVGQLARTPAVFTTAIAERIRAVPAEGDARA